MPPILRNNLDSFHRRGSSGLNQHTLKQFDSGINNSFLDEFTDKNGKNVKFPKNRAINYYPHNKSEKWLLAKLMDYSKVENVAIA
jgi:hypothetical protein